MSCKNYHCKSFILNLNEIINIEYVEKLSQIYQSIVDADKYHTRNTFSDDPVH